MALDVVLMASDESVPDGSSQADILEVIDGHIQELDSHVQQLDSHVTDIDADMSFYSSYYRSLPEYFDSQASFNGYSLSYLHIFLITFFTVLGIVVVCKVAKWIEFLFSDR
jgi:hypothetical protein